ncbi:genetic competence negative regulator [Cohnella thailandensis]|uniref:Genetic competence negative regulator n=1 Tax=Cohnella thailandensis TaxID=557557 RepID=A0A841SWV5_9BACL|nr:genetic competence negative regulator [Cohnella thailandensis]MBB6635419.1 genetic competence negative regulator [Cohnella thailandensis]MBP1974799.1 adapter protein MecA 1/2 [Cohnella thailandensis]
MRMERLSQDKIRIFLTFDDLTERGIQKEDMWREIPKVHELFSEMMDQAYSELGFDASGPLAVEVFAMPAQGMVVIVTRGKIDKDADSSSDDELDEEVYEMEVTLEQSEAIIYRFRDIEDAIGAAKMLNNRLTDEGRMYRYQNQWILCFDPASLESSGYHALIAVLAEYGEATSVTPAVLEEYGKLIIASNAVKVLAESFS